MFNHRKLPQFTKRMALAHMIGQMQQMHLTITTSDAAALIGCTKATAKTYLDKMVRDGIVTKRVDVWRNFVPVYYWELTGIATERYKLNFYKSQYLVLINAKGIFDGE